LGTFEDINSKCLALDAELAEFANVSEVDYNWVRDWLLKFQVIIDRIFKTILHYFEFSG
jgi:hypothetical protein